MPLPHPGVRSAGTLPGDQVQGSGWGVLSWEPLGRRLVVERVCDHHGNVGQGTTERARLEVSVARAERVLAEIDHVAATGAAGKDEI